MKSRTQLFLISFLSVALLASGYYLQHFHDMLPCPLCVLQRYAFLGIAVFTLVFALDDSPRLGAALGSLFSLSGVGVAGYHLWVKAHPNVSCGIDPVETVLNHLFVANLWPSMFRADGLCTADYAPILGLSIPQWALFWFVAFSLALLRILFRSK